jgi:hypothetical protein
MQLWLFSYTFVACTGGKLWLFSQLSSPQMMVTFQSRGIGFSPVASRLAYKTFQSCSFRLPFGGVLLLGLLILILRKLGMLTIAITRFLLFVVLFVLSVGSV